MRVGDDANGDEGGDIHDRRPAWHPGWQQVSALNANTSGTRSHLSGIVAPRALGTPRPGVRVALGRREQTGSHCEARARAASTSVPSPISLVISTAMRVTFHSPPMRDRSQWDTPTAGRTLVENPTQSQASLCASRHVIGGANAPPRTTCRVSDL